MMILKWSKLPLDYWKALIITGSLYRAHLVMGWAEK